MDLPINMVMFNSYINSPEDTPKLKLFSEGQEPPGENAEFALQVLDISTEKAWEKQLQANGNRP